MKPSRNRRPLPYILGASTAIVGILFLARGFAADLTKRRIELPPKRILASQTAPGPTSQDSEFVNPNVEPGKVHWHKTFADACTAAKKSGKPVLLFQMMGKLDERFC